MEDTNLSFASSQATASSSQNDTDDQLTKKNAKKDWRLLARFDSLERYEDFIQLRMPYNVNRTSHSRTYCGFDKSNKHKTFTEYRYCKPHIVNLNEFMSNEIPC